MPQQKRSSFHLHNCFVDEVRVPILQADEVALNRIGFGAIRCEEPSAFHALPRDLAAHGFGDQFGEQHLSMHGCVQAMLTVEIDSDGRRSCGNNDR